MNNQLSVVARKTEATAAGIIKPLNELWERIYEFSMQLALVIHHVLIPAYIFYYLYNSKIDLSAFVGFRSEIGLYPMLIKLSDISICIANQILDVTSTFTAGECLLLGLACFLFWTGKKAV